MIINKTGTINQRKTLSVNPLKWVLAPQLTNPVLSSNVGNTPKPKYPAVNNEKATSIDLRKPILSAYAPVKIGSKYNPPEKRPEIILASKSLKPKIVDK